jgi:diguanylate cyclase (GGDEF)-like protein/PAS domain S-box-containing protein
MIAALRQSPARPNMPKAVTRIVLQLRRVRSWYLLVPLFANSAQAATPGVPRENTMAPLLAANGWLSLAIIALLLLALAVTLLLRRREARHMAALLEKEQRLATVLDSVEACVFIKTPDLRYTYVNRRMAEMLGRPIGEILGSSDEDLFDAPTAAHLRAHDRQVLENGEKIVVDETLVSREANTPPQVLLSVKLPLRSPSGGIESLCGISTDVTEHREVLEHNHRLAFYHPLTGLPNRGLLMERLEQALREIRHRRGHGALMLIDLDQFKKINDISSHEEGDRVLQQLATRLSEMVRDTDTLAHIGADEFVLLVRDLDHKVEMAARHAERVAARLLEMIPSIQIEEEGVSVTGSIGITLFSGKDASAGETMQQADLALEQAKRSGGNNLQFFSAEMQQMAMERVRLERDLQRALEREELRVFYQVQVDEAGQTCGFEALLRWMHPKLGLLAPNLFIPVAEQTRLIQPIGRWVLEQTCRQLAEWAEIPDRSQLSIAVNVSAIQFRQDDFVDEVHQILKATAIDPSLLIVEVTESVLMDNPEQVRTTLSELRGLGIKVALDDFGTGYSSLNYLKKLPLDRLKIDRSFVAGIPEESADVAIAETILNLAKNLGLQVIAEGVETEAQSTWLRSRGCTGFQGFLFGHPAPVDQLPVAAQ